MQILAVIYEALRERLGTSRSYAMTRHGSIFKRIEIYRGIKGHMIVSSRDAEITISCFDDNCLTAYETFTVDMSDPNSVKCILQYVEERIPW